MRFSQFITEAPEKILTGQLIRCVGAEHRLTPEEKDVDWAGYIDCRFLDLTSLEGAPKEVGGNFYCQDNKLKTLVGAPKIVKGVFNCSSNKSLTSLKGLPEVGADVMCHDCSLTSLKGAPEYVKGRFDCSDNPISSLEYAPKRVKENFMIVGCQLTNLKNIHSHIKSVGGHLSVMNNPIKSHVLGVLLIEDLEYFYMSNKTASAIINKYLHYLGKGRHGVIDCQNELIEAGLESYAQL